MSSITTHILDTALGKPAQGVAVTLVQLSGDETTPIGEATTDDDGRVAPLVPPGGLTPGVYRLTFETASYFASTDRESFYPAVEIAFRVEDAAQHYHVPLLLSPFGYSTYRGS